MKKMDIILIIVIAVVSGIAYLVMNLVVNASAIDDGIAVVIFEDKKILEIYLDDGDYKKALEDLHKKMQSYLKSYEGK